MADGVLTGREGGPSRSGDDDLVDGGCGHSSLSSGSGSGLGDFGFGFVFAPPILPSPLVGFCWTFWEGEEGDFLPWGCFGSGFFEG